MSDSVQQQRERLPCKAIELGYGAMGLGGMPVTCVGVMRFTSQPGVKHMRETIMPRMIKIPRFHAKMVRKTFGGYFERVPANEIETDYHFRTPFSDANEPVTQAQVDEVLSQVYDHKMDTNKPLWFMIYIDRVEDGSSVLIAAIDHGVGDGASLVETLLLLADKHPDPSADDSTDVNDVTVVDPKLRHKRRPLPKMGFFDRMMLNITGSIDGITRALQRADPRSTLTLKDARKPSPHKLVARSTPISMDRVKAVKNRFDGASVNDIFAAVLAMTINACLKEKNDPLFGKNKVTATFPIDMRRRNGAATKFENGSPVNMSSLGEVKLVLKYDDPLDCVHKTILKLNRVKRNPGPAVMLWLIKVAFPLLPPRLNRWLCVRMTTLATVYLSNVPGPPERVQVGGCELSDLSFGFFATVGFYIGLISYAGTMSANVVMDATVSTKPAEVCKHWTEQFEILEALALKKDS